MSAIISFHVDSSATVSVADLDLKIHQLFDTKEEAISQMKVVVDTFADQCNKERGLNKVENLADLKKVEDGYNFSKAEEGNNFSMWVKYSKLGRIYGKSHKSKRIRLFVIVETPFFVPEAPVAPPVLKKQERTPKKEVSEDDQTIEQKHYANYGAMIVELQEKLKQRQEQKEEQQQHKEDQGQREQEKSEVPETPAPSPISCRSLTDEKERFDQFVEEAVKELSAFDFIENEKDKMVEQGWKIFMNPMFDQNDLTDEEIYNMPAKRRCISYDEEDQEEILTESFDSSSSFSLSSSFSSSSDDVYYILAPKAPKEEIDEDDSISYSEFFDSDDDTEMLSSSSSSLSSLDEYDEDENDQYQEPAVQDPLPIVQEYYSYAPQREPQYVREYAQVEPTYEGYVNPCNSYLPYDITFEPSMTMPLLTPEQQMDSYDYNNNFPSFQQEQPMPYDELQEVERYYKSFQEAIEDWRNTYTGQMDYSYWPESTPMVPKRGKNVW